MDCRVREAKDDANVLAKDMACDIEIDEVAALNLYAEQAKEEIMQLKQLYTQGQLDRFKKDQIQHLSPRQQ